MFILIASWSPVAPEVNAPLIQTWRSSVISIPVRTFTTFRKVSAANGWFHNICMSNGISGMFWVEMANLHWQLAIRAAWESWSWCCGVCVRVPYPFSNSTFDRWRVQACPNSPLFNPTVAFTHVESGLSFPLHIHVRVYCGPLKMKSSQYVFTSLSL